MREVKVRTPGKKTVIHYKKRQPGKAVCTKCGDILKGVANERPYKMKNMPLTKKRPERPYGGVLCSKCMRKVIVAKARE
jgi:large subunit ribosomal protein L34e